MSFKNRPALLPIEWITLGYTFFTTLVILVLWSRISTPLQLLEGRLLIVVAMGLLWLIHRAHPSAGTRFLRVLFPVTLLNYWYPDTYAFCQVFPNLDHIFARADLSLFGCQPSIEFSRLLPEKLWSELFHMGYFSYYLMIAATVLVPLVRGTVRFERAAFIVMGVFFLYYTIYLFLPVAGPQYYFQAVGFGLIEEGHFPILGDYFRYRHELAPSPGPDGFFHNLVEMTQASGERPTAAFPSSHVGVSTVLLFILYGERRLVFYLCLPFYVFLCCATVYIQAHYLIDVIGGLVTAVVFYYVVERAWRKAQASAEV